MSMKKKNHPAFQEAGTSVVCHSKPTGKTVADEKIAFVETTAPAQGMRQGIQKEYLDGKKSCQVTFRLPKTAAPNGNKVFIVGDFNNWNIHAHQMKKQKNGDHAISLSLASGREYQFRYLIDDSIWENDWKADKYVKSPYGNCDNSVVIV